MNLYICMYVCKCMRLLSIYDGLTPRQNCNSEMKILRIRSVDERERGNSPAQTDFANVANAAALALPPIVLVEDRGGAALRIDDGAIGEIACCCSRRRCTISGCGPADTDTGPAATPTPTTRPR